jgi:hypothetical protein
LISYSLGQAPTRPFGGHDKYQATEPDRGVAAFRLFGAYCLASGPGSLAWSFGELEGFDVAEAVSGADFLAWASGAGIGFDPRYPGTDCLSLLPPRESARFWDVPDQAYSIPYLVEAVLNALDPWEAGYLWPRIGRWPSGGDPGLANERVRDMVWRVLGMPLGWAGAARVGRDDRSSVVAALFASLGFGGDSTSDLYFVPDHARQIVWAGHHDVIHLACADEARMLEFVRHMEGAGFALPTEPPDATFKSPAWMQQEAAAPGTSQGSDSRVT